MMTRFPVPLLVLWVSGLQFLQNAWRQTSVDKVVGVVSNYLGSVDLHASPSPVLEAKYLAIEFIWKLLRPCCKFLPTILVQYSLNGLPVTKVLISRGLVDKRNNADRRQTAHQNIASIDNVLVLDRNL